MFIGIVNIINLWRGYGEVTTRKTGPNDTSRVVWAISKCFHFILIVFYIYTNHVTHFYRYY